MKIHRITLNNYRLYGGENSITFNEQDGQNIFLISGENGFGKTTFLHSLLWCLYGRLMSDVDESVRKEIVNKGGYSIFLKNNLNINAKQSLSHIDSSIATKIKRSGYSVDQQKIQEYSTYSVAIEFSDIFIPSIKCRSLIIKRSYDLLRDLEDVEILIDGQQNELTREIGSDVFVNDFILSKDIARFFFFDSERIVALAETTSTDEKRRLNSAYNEVLGVKKYEDLKKNLENLRLRFRRKSGDIEGRNKLIALIEQQEKAKADLENIEHRFAEIEEEKKRLDGLNEQYQVELLREGNNMTIEELRRQEALLKATKAKDEDYKAKLKTFLEVAPFAIAGNLLKLAKEQVEKDHSASQAINSIQNRNALLAKIAKDLTASIETFCSEEYLSDKLKAEVDSVLGKYVCEEVVHEKLLNLTEKEYKEFVSMYSHITSTFKSEFLRLADDYKKNRQIIDRTSKKVANMQSNENDSVIKSIRIKKNEVEQSLAKLETELHTLIENKALATKDIASLTKRISELSKTVSLDDSDIKKDVVAEDLIAELNTFLTALKAEKKASLEKRIKVIMNSLMHKEDFIGSVCVSINEDIMDIELLAKDGGIIRKDSLSKGEQQLYATSLLKALVDESGIQFPVFIDSPLQKFDKSHSRKIITDFYPTISKQVVLFPLLHKELTEPELEVMKPLVNAAYLIKNNESRSYFMRVDINKLMVD